MADSTLTESSSSSAPSGAADPTALTVEHYLVERELAHGGLGRVLVAQDRRLGRRVALKVPLHASSDVAHFRHEVEITSRLQHPSIVPLYEAGRLPSGEPFFAMKLLEGRPLSTAISDAKGARERLALLPSVIAVAEAIAYAHDQGVVHRDLKPSNVLLGPFGEAVVLDWGEASRLSRESGREVVGTPSYMAPEQARGAPVLPTNDVYALGALLYHVVSGQPPYRGDSPSVLTQLAAGPPPPVEERWPETPPELAAIIRKAMAREAGERYPSARELAADLRRFETGQLVSSYAYSAWGLFRRWVRRNAVPVVVGLIATAALAATAVVSFRRVAEARTAAERRRDMLTLAQAHTALATDPTDAVAWLKQYPPGGADWSRVRTLFAEALDRGVARQVFSRVSFEDDSADGHTQAVNSFGNAVELWRDGRKLRTVSVPDDELMSGLEMSPDGRQMMMLSRDGTARLVEVDSGAMRLLWRGDGVESITGGDMRWSPDGRFVSAFASRNELWLYPVAGGAPRRLRGHTMVSYDHVFSPDGKWFASASVDKTVRLWSVDGEEVRVLAGHQAEVRTVAFSPDGTQLVSAAYDGTARVWSLEGKQLRVLGPKKGRLLAAAFSPDGKTIASVGDDAVVRLYDESGVRELRGHTQVVNVLSFSSDGKKLATGGEDEVLRVWDVATGDSVALRGHHAPITGVRMFGDGSYVRSTGFAEAVRLWHVPALLHRRVVEAAAPVINADWSADGKWQAVSSLDKKVRLCEAASGNCRVLGEHPGPALGVAFSPDSRTLASSGDDGSLRLWNLADGSVRAFDSQQGPLKKLVWSPDSRRLLTGGDARELKVWDVERGEGRVLWKHDDSVLSAAWSPDGKQIASAGMDSGVRLGDLEGHVQVLSGHTEWVMVVAFSRDGKQLASGAFDRTVRLWDLVTGKGRVLGRHDNSVMTLSWSPDGAWIASGSLDRTARLWNPRTGEVRVLRGHEANLRPVVFSRDSKLLATAADDQMIRVWEVATGMGRALPGHGAGPIRSLAFSPDGKRLLSASFDRTARLWTLDALAPLPLEPQALREVMDQATVAELDEQDRLE